MERERLQQPWLALKQVQALASARVLVLRKAPALAQLAVREQAGPGLKVLPGLATPGPCQCLQGHLRCHQSPLCPPTSRHLHIESTST